MFQSITILSSIIVAVLGAPQLDGRIVGGIPTTIEEFPYQISLQHAGLHICGGSIISDRHILTAAHCTDKTPAYVLTVRAGSSYRGYRGKIYYVKEIHQNPNFTMLTMDYDVSVLVLETPLDFSTAIAPIPLISKYGKISSDANLIITGWGKLSQNGWSSRQLQMVELPYVDNKQCQQSYLHKENVTDRMMCAGTYHGDKDSCQGDSGGPAVTDGLLVGIVSWGYGCARPEYPGVYTRISEIRDFIANIIHF